MPTPTPTGVNYKYASVSGLRCRKAAVFPDLWLDPARRRSKQRLQIMETTHSGATITVVVGHDRLERQGPGETQARRSGAGERASSAAPGHRVPRPLIARAAISPLGLIGGLVVAIVATGLALEAWWKSVAPVACAVGAVGVVTFFGFIGIVGGVPAVIAHRARMRDAIAATFVVVYFVLLGLLAFFRGEDAPGISETLVTNFTVLMGVVVAFYFGATAYERVRLRAAEDADLSSEQPPVPAERAPGGRVQEDPEATGNAASDASVAPPQGVSSGRSDRR